MKKKNAQKEQDTSKPVLLPIELESQHMLHTTEEFREKLDEFYPRLLTEDFTDEVNRSVESLKRASSNLSKAMSHTYAMKDELNSRLQDSNRQKKRKFLKIPANAAIDLTEQNLHHFAAGLNGYKLLLLCFIGSFLGVVIEMLWCLVTHGYLESRAGLVYGPFNLLYGIGAVVLTVTLYRFRNRGAWLSFSGGILVGSVVEYVCSWGQELVFGSRSWDYSRMPFNLNGRICLLYSIFWGILGVFWIKKVYPVMAEWILKLPNRFGKILTWGLVVFFVFNACMSGLSLMRWSQRNADIPASNAMWVWMDDHFPDERMERVYANMVFSEE